jgi:hypothetical protein
MNNKSIFVLGALIVVAALFLFKDPKKRSKSVDDESEYSETESDENSSRQKNQNSTPASTDLTQTQQPVANTQVAPQLNEAVMKRYAQHLMNMEKCLRLQNQNFNDATSTPSAENLISGLRPNLGDTVVQLEDWAQYDLLDKSGVKKRIRVDVDYPDGATPNRRLSMYTVNSYGALEIDNLTNDQSDNPNLAYIESLKEGMQTLTEEKAVRVYFSQGEELLYTMKNGQIDSFSISKMDRAYNCTNLMSENSACTCP